MDYFLSMSLAKTEERFNLSAMITEKIPGLQKLSDSEKLLLINELWDSLAEGKDTLPVPESHKRILDERLREHEENPDEGSSWEEVRSRILGDKAP